MSLGLIGQKIGMTRVFQEDGRSVPVTVVEVSPNRVTQVKTVETDGYEAVQVATGERRANRVSKALAGHYAKAKVAPGTRLAEFRVSAESVELPAAPVVEGEEGDAQQSTGLQVGSEIPVNLFEAGQKVDVQGTSIGKGFAGGIKRWGFGGLRATHGVSISHRSLGSTGQCQDPGKVFKGKKMGGHMGARKRTQQGLEVVRVDAERNVILVKGSVPGSKGGSVIIKPSVKAKKIMELKQINGSALKVSDDVFGADYNEALIHQALVAYQAGARQGTRGQKNRSAVSGGGAKPWRQKGTGRARAGTSRSPIWRGGGKTFPATTQDFSQKMNRKAYRAAIRSILSELVRQDRLVVSDDFAVSEPKTKQLISKLNDMKLDDVLLVTHDLDENLALAQRNLYKVGVMDPEEINPLSLIGFDKVLITSEAVKQIEEKLA